MSSLAPAGAVDCYTKAEHCLTAITKLIRQQRPFSLVELSKIAGEMVASLAQDNSLMVRAITHQSGPSLIGNLLHVAIYSIKIGEGLEYRPDELDKLALAGLIHDAGMFRLPEDLLAQTARWTAAQLDQLHRHPTVGAELVKQAAPNLPWLAEVVSQEHERIDGSGYPKGLKGNQMHEFAQIIGLADMMDAMMRARINRKALLPHEAVRMVLIREKNGFSKRVFKGLLKQFSLFPVGTWVKLTSGEIGEVVRSNPRFPLRPTVRVEIDASGLRLREPRDNDLSLSALVHVEGIVDKTTLSA